MTSRSERKEQPHRDDEWHMPLCGCETAKNCGNAFCPHAGKLPRERKARP